jgi:hypothetical protein
MPDESTPKPKKADLRSKRKRRARPNWSARRKAVEAKKIAERQAIEQRLATREAERQAKINEAKAAFQALIDQDNAKKEQKLASSMPVDMVELCRIHGLPLDTPIHPRYNLLGVPPDKPIQAVEAIAFGRDWPADYGGLGAFLHFKNFVDLTWPDIVWNPWLEDMARSLCDSSHAVKIGRTKLKFVNWVGAGSAGKTFGASLFAVAWYMVDQANGFNPRTSITLTSTSKGIIAQRMWPVVQKLFHEAKIAGGENKLKWGHMIDSQKIICPVSDKPGEEKKRDMKHSICALAVESGELVGALDKIKGRHTERMMLIVDEANSTPQAIFECIPNMLTSVTELIVLVIGNAGSRLDPHGICCEPRKGWKSITIEDTMWETNGVAKWGIGPGICLHFDGAKSPNVIAGRTDHKHIYSFERWQQVLRMGDEYRNTLQHWSQDRGFWPPDGLSTTIFSEALVTAHDGTGRFDFFSEVHPCAALDPAFGGDDCLIQFGIEGDIRQGRHAMMLTEWKLVPFDPDSADPIDFQIARWVIKECKARGIEPRWFGLDATGIGRGVAAILRHEWSNSIQVIEFGGTASDLPASQDDPRPSREVYANRVTELWYSTRELLIANQLKGLYHEAVSQACSRVYEFVNRKYKVESKVDMKSRLGRSPDHFDAITILTEVARRNGLIISQGPAAGRKSENASWREISDSLTSLASSDYTEAAHFGQYAEVS